MPLSTLVHSAPMALNLNQPGTYLHWSFIEISLANLMVIVVMVLIFGAALLIPFPHKASTAAASGSGEAEADVSGSTPAQEAAAPEPGDADMWTAKIRTKSAALLPPKKLLPDRQPAYVASWVYVFGVATLAALGIVIISGFALALGGSDWWHVNPVGHFFNSLHLWSVELFMAFMVIHLWGKFWMAAWRGRRAMTWITGMLAFLASVITAFTGYLSQQNFDSQWIATNGKDAFNAVGIGAIWNAMNFGQMFMWHIVLMPAVLAAIVGGHILLVRVRGVSHPLPTQDKLMRGRAAYKAAAKADARAWRGPNRRYDIVKEATIATVIVSVLVVVLAGILSSPDVPPITIQTWAKAMPGDFVATAAGELNGSMDAANYGPPYQAATSQSLDVQQVGPFNWQTMGGVTQPINAAKAYVIDPLNKLAGNDSQLDQAVATFENAPKAQQQAWADAYVKVVGKVKFVNDLPVVPAANDGPVPVMMANEYSMARSGALDAALLAQSSFYGTNYTKPLLFIADGGYYNNQATDMHLTGDQWGVMNETGSYPGQPWLWFFQAWYHIAPFNNSPSVDIWAAYLTGVGTLLLLFVPFIPGLRDIPRAIPLYRLVWSSWYRNPASAEHSSQAKADG